MANIINIITAVPIQNGRGVLDRPPVLTKNDIRNALQVHAVYAEALANHPDLAYITCPASTYKSPSHHQYYQPNILAMFVPPQEKPSLQYIPKSLWIPLNTVPEEFHFVIKDINNNVLPIKGHLLVEVKGQVDDKLLL